MRMVAEMSKTNILIIRSLINVQDIAARPDANIYIKAIVKMSKNFNVLFFMSISEKLYNVMLYRQ